jgi:internalin A
MAEDFDGLGIARRRIAEEAERRTGFLDLSQLGLAELPAELFALRHLRRLHLGDRLAQRDGAWDAVHTQDPPNRLRDKLGRLAALPNLEALSVSGTGCASLDPLASLARLKWLDCGGTVFDPGQVSDLGPLAKLTALQSLDCRPTQVADLGPLAKLTALQSLDCSSALGDRGHVSNLGPLAKLTALQSLDCSYTQVADLGPLPGP